MARKSKLILESVVGVYPWSAVKGLPFVSDPGMTASGYNVGTGLKNPAMRVTVNNPDSSPRLVNIRMDKVISGIVVNALTIEVGRIDAKSYVDLDINLDGTRYMALKEALANARQPSDWRVNGYSVDGVMHEVVPFNPFKTATGVVSAPPTPFQAAGKALTKRGHAAYAAVRRMLRKCFPSPDSKP